MIYYDGARFHTRLLCQVRGSVLPFAFAVALPSALLASGLKVASTMMPEGVTSALGIDPTSHQVIGAAFSGLNFLIGFLVVFRTQQSVSRFWEGLTAVSTMQAAWFDATSGLIAFTKRSKASAHDVLLFRNTLVRLVSLLNACVLMELCAGFGESSGDAVLQTKRAFELELIDADGLDSRTLLSINSTKDKVHLLFAWIQHLIVDYSDKSIFSVAPPILSRCFQELGNGMVSYRQASKIACIPMPFPYVQATEMLLLSHWLIIPFLMCLWVTSPVWTGVLTFVQVAVFWSLNCIATQLENPFGEDINDLPAEDMQRKFNEELLLLLRPSTGVTARLSKHAVLTEVDDSMTKLQSSVGSSLSISKNGLKRSYISGHSMSLGELQMRLNDLECGDPYSPQSSNDGTFDREISCDSPMRLANKEVLLPVPEALSLEPADQRGVCDRSREVPMIDASARSASSGCCDHPGENEVPMAMGRISRNVPVGLLHGWRKSPDSPSRADEKSPDPLHALALRQLLADLACLPDIMNQQLLCLQELVQIARDGRERVHAGRPVAVGAAENFGAFSARHCNVGADTPRRTATDRVAATEPLFSGCCTVRSRGAHQSAWSKTLQ